MPKIRTTKLNVSDQLVTPETVNDNADTALSAYNGRLGHQNMPVGSVTESKLVSMTTGTALTTGTDIEKMHVIGPTQAYYRTTKSSLTTSNDIWTPLTTIDFGATSWTRGFNALHDFSGWENFPIHFAAKEGMLIGCASMDWHHGTQEGSGAHYIGHEWWTEIGVFVNNILVARSGKVHPRRHTTHLPFSVPVGSQNVSVEVRFIMSNFLVPNGADLTANARTTDFEIFGATIWCRNQYR
jgi:hypothetical protein